MVGYYYKALVYEHSTVENRSDKTYGEQHNGCDEGQVPKLTSHVWDSVTYKTGVQHPVRIVAAPFCAMRYLNDGSIYLEIRPRSRDG